MAKNEQCDIFKDLTSEDILNHIYGMYGHDGYAAETVAEILDVPLRVTNHLIKVHHIGQGDY